jgi:transposase-like protein
MARASPEIKAAAEADLLAGEQPAVVAAKYGLKPEQVRDWKRNLKNRQGHPTDIPTAPTPYPTARRPTLEAQQQHIGAIVLDLLRAKLEASAAIAYHATHNRAWLEKQSAAELATLGQWLDSTALAIGDRLAGAAPADADAEERD